MASEDGMSRNARCGGRLSYPTKEEIPSLLLLCVACKEDVLLRKGSGTLVEASDPG